MPDLDYLLYVREDAGRELPSSGLVLKPRTPMPLFGKGAVDGELAVVLVKRGDCIYCDAEGQVPAPAEVFESVAEHQPEGEFAADHEADDAHEPAIEPTPA